MYTQMYSIFYTIKDQGGIPTEPFTTPVCTYTARLMSKLASPENTHFQFSLGDNFYDDGVVNVEDTRFQDSFEKVFTDDHTMDTPWFFNLGLALGTRNLDCGFNFRVKIEFLIFKGNHDYRGDKMEGNTTAQIKYTYISKRW